MNQSEIGVMGVRIEYILGHRQIIIERADKHILISDELLANADERLISKGDGIVTFHASNGDVSYGLSHRDYARRVQLGTRSGDWPAAV